MSDRDFNDRADKDAAIEAATNYLLTRGGPMTKGPTFAIPPGAPLKACRTCTAKIFWIETTTGRRMPVNPDGTSHFATCPDAAAHRKPREAR